MDFGSLLTTALSIISIATLAGLGLLRGTITNLRENLRDARDEITDKERRTTEDEQTIKKLKADRDALARVARGEAQWTAQGQTLDENHEQLVRLMTEALKELAGIRNELMDVIRKMAAGSGN